MGTPFQLSGEKTYVLDGHIANEILVAARVDGELALFHVAEDASGLSREVLPPLDPTRRIAALHFDNTPASRISSGDVSGNLECALDRAIVALAAEQLGGRAARSRDDGRLCEDALPVWPADRFVSGHQAPVCGHAGRGRIRAVRGLQRGFRERRRSRVRIDRGADGEILLFGRLSAYCKSEHPDFTAGWVSPGSTAPTYTSSGRKRARSSSEMRASTASEWRPHWDSAPARSATQEWSRVI